MRIYIAYKYRYLKDKAGLKSDLQQLSDFFDSLGHKAFILGRDVQKWENHKYSRVSTTVDILKNIGKHDMVFVYSNSDVHTNGIPVEMALAKMFGLKIVFARQKGLKVSWLEKLATKVIEFEDLQDLKVKAQRLL